MNRRKEFNRRTVALLLTLILSVLTLGNGGTWTCPDGTPCPPDCPLLYPQTAKTASAVHCSQCPMPGETAVAQSVASVRCPSKHCSLSIKNAPLTSLQERTTHFYIAAILPDIPTVFAPETKIAVYETRPLDFFPQRFLRSHYGRAPPILL